MKKILTKKWWLEDYAFRTIFLVLSLAIIIWIGSFSKDEIFKGNYIFQIFKFFCLFMGSLTFSAILTTAIFCIIALLVSKLKKRKN